LSQIVALTLASCATVKETYSADGRKAYTLKLQRDRAGLGQVLRLGGRALLGVWGAGPVVEVNPVAGFQAGIIGMRVLVGVDVAVQQPAAVCVSTSIT
jgi:hypothetical protein